MLSVLSLPRKHHSAHSCPSVPSSNPPLLAGNSLTNDCVSHVLSVLSLSRAPPVTQLDLSSNASLDWRCTYPLARALGADNLQPPADVAGSAAVAAAAAAAGTRASSPDRMQRSASGAIPPALGAAVPPLPPTPFGTAATAAAAAAAAAGAGGAAFGGEGHGDGVDQAAGAAGGGLAASRTCSRSLTFKEEADGERSRLLYRPGCWVYLSLYRTGCNSHHAALDVKLYSTGCTPDCAAQGAILIVLCCM